MHMRHGIIALVLFLLPLTAAAECPLKSNSITTWTIDSVEPADTNAQCNEKQNNDCSLLGVVKRINEVLPDACGDALQDPTGPLKTATLRLVFKKGVDGVTSATLTTGLVINVYSGLGTLVIDGALDNGHKFQFKKNNSTDPLLSLQCRQLTAANTPTGCTILTSAAKLDIRNLGFRKGNKGLYISGSYATFPEITVEHVTFANQASSGLSLDRVESTVLHIEDVTVDDDPDDVANLTNGLYFQRTHIVDGVIRNVHVTGSGLPTISTSGIRFSDLSRITKLIIDGVSIEGTKQGVHFSELHAEGGKNIDITNSMFTSSEYPLYFDGVGDHITLTSVQATGAGQSIAPEKSGVFFANLTEPAALTGITITHSRVAQSGHGITIKGNVHDVKLDTVELSDIGLNGLNVIEESNIAPPTKVRYTDVTFRQVATPVLYASKSTIENLFADDLLNTPAAGKTAPLNNGIDTPTKVTLVRDSTKPKWMQVEFTHNTAVTKGVLYWAYQGSWYPMVMDNFVKDADSCAGDLCTFRGETQFDAKHFLLPPAFAATAATPAPYSEDLPMEDLSVALHVSTDIADDTPDVAGHDSMPTESLSLLSTNWKDQEILTVDVQDDYEITDASKSKCTTQPEDCSLRGAMVLAENKRFDENKTHLIVVRADAAALPLFLAAPLSVKADHLKIEGTAETPLTIVPDGQTTGELLVLENEKQTLSHLILDGESKIPTLVKSIEAEHLIIDTTLLNTTSSAVTVIHSNIFTTAVKKRLQMQNVEFGVFGKAGVDLSPAYPKSFTHLSNIRMQRTVPEKAPSLLVKGSAAAPALLKTMELDLKTRTLTLHGTLANLESVQVYLSFPNDPMWTLFPVAIDAFSYHKDNKGFDVTLTLPEELTASQLIELGSMRVYIMGEKLQWNIPVTTNMSLGEVVNTYPEQWDSDGDKIFDINDISPLNANPLQEDTDGDGEGDVVDLDLDGDKVDNNVDTCQFVKSADQSDTDGDGLGNPCDDDDDEDGVKDTDDNCPFDANADQETLLFVDGKCVKDLDKDGVADDIDNCQGLANTAQTNSDGDTKGDACDSDDDGDGKADDSDNCPLIANATQTDTDSDDAGDACDDDDDADDVADSADNCPLLANADQGDPDGDALGNACDDDDDADGVADAQDNCPLDMNAAQTDTDSDGPGDACDTETLNPEPITAPPTAPEAVDGAAPLPSDNDAESEQPAAKPDDSTPPPAPKPVANAESGGCTLMLR